jgi:uncharacterized membrane protein YfcA
MNDGWLVLIFFLAALIYSMAGFGGGSTYIAILTLAGVTYDRIPLIALVCNIVVVAGGLYHFVRAGHFSWQQFWPFALGSVPLALLGGRLPLTQGIFLWLLGTTLLAAGILLLWPVKHRELQAPPPRCWCVAIGAGLGLLSGMVGIGGGIFLAPLLSLLRWAPPKQIAAIATAFIFLNSMSGLAGQLLKPSAVVFDWQWMELTGAVFIGGQIGSRLGATQISQARVRQLTGAIVLFAAVRILADRLWR